MTHATQVRQVFNLLLAAYEQGHWVYRWEFDDLFPKVENVTARLSNLRAKLKAKGWDLECNTDEGRKRSKYRIIKLA